MISETSPSVKLAPPGAGLPAVELFLGQLGFRLRCTLNSDEAELRRFQSEAGRIESLARTVPPDQGRVPILIERIMGIEDSSRQWSVFMVLDHLGIVNEDITRIVVALTHERAIDHEVRIQDVKPRVGVGPEALDRFLKSVEVHEATVKQLGRLGRIARHPHPWFGPLTAHGWHCLAAFHESIHRRHLERILQGLKHVGA